MLKCVAFAGWLGAIVQPSHHVLVSNKQPRMDPDRNQPRLDPDHNQPRLDPDHNQPRLDPAHNQPQSTVTEPFTAPALMYENQHL